MSPISRGRTAALLAGVAAATLLLPALAHAQQPTELPPIETNVSPSEPPRPGGGTEISGDRLSARRAGAADTISLLSGEAAVSLNANGGLSSLPIVRGLGDERVLVTVDGAEATLFCPNHMIPPGSYVSPSRVQEIALRPTLSPVSAGGDNLAGVIAITTRSPVFADEGVALIHGGEIGAGYRSASDGVGANLRLTTATDRISLAYDGSWNRAGNYRTGDGREVRSTEFETSDHALILAYRTDRGLISLQGGRQHQPYQGFPTQRMDLTENDTRFLNLRLEETYGWGDLLAKASWREVDHEMNFLADKGGAANGGMPMLSNGRDLGASLAVTLPLSEGAVRLGTELRQADLDDWWPPVAGSMMMGPQTYWNINGGERDRTAVWAEWEANPAERWTTHLGARLERVTTDTGDVQPYSWTGMMNAPDAAAARAFNALDRRRDDDNLDLTAKATWRASDIAAVEFGYARKTRSPSLYERYAWGRGMMSSSMTSFAGDGNAYVGDPDLRPEVAQHFAVSLALSDPDARRSFTVTAYQSDVDDFIDAIKLADLQRGFVQLRFANVDAKLYGLDASGRTQIWEGDWLGQVDLTGTAAYVRGENRTSGDDLYHMAPLTARLGVEQRRGRWTNAAELELVDRKDTVNALRHEPVTAGYVLVNLRSSWVGERTRVDIAVENLLDKAYDLPLGGVSFGDFKADGMVGPIRPLPGMGRSINVGLTRTF